MSEVKNDPKLDENFIYNHLIINNDKYLIGVNKKENIYQVVLTNFKDYYQEAITQIDAHKRFKDLNPMLITENFEEIIDDFLTNISNYMVTCTLECVKLKNKIDGGWIKFEINFKKTSSDHFYNDLVEVLFSSISELQHRYNYLINTIKKKDEEIAEYKAQGVELLRSSLITKPFDEKLLNTETKNLKCADKIDAFLKTMTFYNSIKHLQNLNFVKQEISQVEEGPSIDADDLQINVDKKKKKKNSSSSLRCAVDPNFEHKVKIPKLDSNFKYL